MLLLLATAAILLAALSVERIRLDRSRSSVPLRIAVTGTRGKTTVVRLLASVLREDGRAVLAKTTGSEPCLVLPDGSVERIRRRGPASILEQKALLHRAARLRADAVVAEVMSIHAENHAVEGTRILVPHLVLATNFLVDHTEAQGNTRGEVGAALALAVPEGATVLVPEGACPASFRSAVEAAGGTLVEVPAGTGVAVPVGRAGEGAPAPFPPFPVNLDLVVAAARRLGVGEEAIRRGIASARHDVGALGVWKAPGQAGAERGAAAPPVHLVNAFAANDPESTMRVYDEVMERLGSPRGAVPDSGPMRCVGLLSLRADRGDRTLQWADALANGLLDRFDALLVTGMHAAALERRVRQARGRMPGRTRTAGSGPPPIRVLRRGSAERLTRAALAELGASGGVVFGFGNIGGLGTKLVEHWSSNEEAVIHGD
ncbi:MAG: Mur ligase family protein [Longimicrobiales bacterium]|nr:Mur ligase family protein [Longimicrobiales bacterium]